MSWTKAKAHCANISSGTDLVVINDEMENKFLQNHITSQFNNFDFWIGLKENGNLNEYVWVDGSTLDFGRELARDPWGLNGQNSVRHIVYSIKQVY